MHSMWFYNTLHYVYGYKRHYQPLKPCSPQSVLFLFHSATADWRLYVSCWIQKRKKGVTDPFRSGFADKRINKNKTRTHTHAQTHVSPKERKIYLLKEFSNRITRAFLHENFALNDIQDFVGRNPRSSSSHCIDFGCLEPQEQAIQENVSQQVIVIG